MARSVVWLGLSRPILRGLQKPLWGVLMVATVAYVAAVVQWNVIIRLANHNYGETSVPWLPDVNVPILTTSATAKTTTESNITVATTTATNKTQEPRNIANSAHFQNISSSNSMSQLSTTQKKNGDHLALGKTTVTNASSTNDSSSFQSTRNLTNITLSSSTLPSPVDLAWKSTTTASTSSTTTTLHQTPDSVVPFERYNGVVIVTKLHGPHQIPLLEQSMCLLHHAYNHRPLYDIVVFTTTPISSQEIETTRRLVHPANLTVVLDNRGLQEEIQALDPIRHQKFLKACQVSSPENLTWWSNCPGRIAYNWQAEFRSWHIWNHPALIPYKTMMWLDTDAFCTQEWTVDPINTFLQNDLVILFDNWPKGTHSGKDVQRRIQSSLNVSLCKVRVVEGKFQSQVTSVEKGCLHGSRVPNIHGFFHITNLDFFRMSIVQRWAQTWIGDGFLQRYYDDQAAVTVPTAVLAPERSWDMRRNGMIFNIFHNNDLDGKKSQRVGGFRKYWANVVQQQFPTAAVHCTIHAGGLHTGTQTRTHYQTTTRHQ